MKLTEKNSKIVRADDGTLHIWPQRNLSSTPPAKWEGELLDDEPKTRQWEVNCLDADGQQFTETVETLDTRSPIEKLVSRIKLQPRRLTMAISRNWKAARFPKFWSKPN